ncbi:MAG: 2-C-methyl-D-erythritol 2,4-cyclodiphosphate synthase [Candidatus Gastranaerophilales bacterium]|nr:2-C-methyl-D-erythritol 2,4-cyclodiphosphate synthase [Candidatus Gastranaerophilales bacterium]
MNNSLRIGNGYDIHKLVKDRKLILGGVKIPYELGLLGHSDADVLVHAIMDAMLGALALGDIGKHFPPDDMKYKDIDSLELLKHVNSLIKEKNYSIINIDTIIQAQKPKLLPFIPQMQEKISQILDIKDEQISIKATTMEGLGAIGEGKGIAAYAVVLFQKVI